MNTESEQDTIHQPQSTRPEKLTVLSVAGVFVGVLAFAGAKQFDLVDNDVAKRAVGVLIGVVLIVTGNMLPKLVPPIRDRMRAASRRSSGDRFAGWVFVLTGLTLTGVWLFAPIGWVKMISAIVGLAAFATVFGSWLRLRTVEHSSGLDAVFTGDATTTVRPTTPPARMAAALILHAIFWVFVMFLADSVWGDPAAQWIAVAFVIGNSVLITMMTGQPVSCVTKTQESSGV